MQTTRASPGAPPKMGRARPRVSLKVQAIGYLSRREHSRQELRVKLLASLRKQQRELEFEKGQAAQHAAPEPDEASRRDAAPEPDSEALVDELLAWLVEHEYLSDARFVESRVNARARKQGTTLIRHELSRHGLVMEPEQLAALAQTEFTRAQALWLRKFGAPATDARLRARQGRFLAARGFASDIIRRVVGGEEEF